MYEWMKYKVAAEVGGQEEQEAFALYEKIKIDELGETNFRLVKELVNKDPKAQQIIPFVWYVERKLVVD